MRSVILLAAFVSLGSCAGSEPAYPPLIPKETAPYVEPTPMQKHWALATCGILTENNKGSHVLLGAFIVNQHNKEVEQQLLEKWWGVHNREELFHTLSWIESGGHRQGFDELTHVLSKASPEQLKNFQALVAVDIERSNSVAIAMKYKNELGAKSLAGWDFSRYVALCGWGYLTGYLTEEEAWQRIMPVARLLQKTFTSWEQLGRNYIIGREFWSWKQTQDRGGATLQSFKRLTTEPDSPWVKLNWNLDLAPPKPPNTVLYASGNNGCMIRINGEEIITVRRDKAGKAGVTLKEGDLITVRLSDRFDINSFWLACLATNEQFLFETSETWSSYIPADTKQWWLTKDAKEQKPAKFTTDKQEYVSLVKKSAATTPHYRQSQPIRSTLTDGTRIAYVFYMVTKQDLIPKK